MKIRIVCFGTVKNKNITSIINEYLSKINHFCKIEIIELNDEKINNEDNTSEIEIALSKEAKKLESHFKKDEFNILLDLNGKQIDSINFSKLIESQVNISKNINFFIGSSYGFDKKIKSNASISISFSDLTFNHQIFRAMLLEQIYRAFTIIKNIKYHK